MRYVQYLDYDLVGKLYDVCGDRGVVILDARNSVHNSILDAHNFNGFRRDFYPAFRLHQGQSFLHSKAITGVIYAKK